MSEAGSTPRANLGAVLSESTHSRAQCHETANSYYSRFTPTKPTNVSDLLEFEPSKMNWTTGQISRSDLSDLDGIASVCLKVHWSPKQPSKTVAIFCYRMETTALVYATRSLTTKQKKDISED